jgi:rubrerythrin
LYNTVDEALDFAISEEEGAAAFYTELAEKTPSSAIKELLLSFAEEERGHKRKLLDVKAGEKMLPQSGETQDLKIADYTVAVEPSSEVSYQEALIIAMKKEKAAYAMYVDLAGKAPDQNLKNLFLGLAREEANHKLRFEIEYDNEVLGEN